MLQKWRTPRAFVLAEVLVVSVIVAILAAVAIPVYTSYVKNQRQLVVDNLAQTAAVSANIFWRRTNTEPTVPDLKLFLPDETRFTVLVAPPSITIKEGVGTRTVTGTARYR